MFVGSFEGDFNQFQTDTQAAIAQFKASGVSRLILDLSNNGGKRLPDTDYLAYEIDSCVGGFVCLGQFLHQFLAGKDFCTNYDRQFLMSFLQGNSIGNP